MQRLIYATILTALIGSNSWAQETAKPADFKPSGKVWGYAFGDYFYKLDADSSNRGILEYSNIPKDNNSFSFRRAYLGYDFNISERLSTEFLLSHESNLDAGGNRTVFIKAANLRIKRVYKYADLIIGQTATPTFSLLEEKVWGYRSIEKTIIDQRKLAGSSDLGIALQGKFDEKGSFGYNVMIGNGTGTKLEVDKYKRFYGNLFAKFFDNKLIVDLYTDYERAQLSPYYKGRLLHKVFLGYQTDPITFGITYLMQTQENYAIFSSPGGSADTSDISASGISVFARGAIVKDKLNFFTRFDYFNPDNNYESDNVYSVGSNPVTESFATAGLDWVINKNVHIMPNIWYSGFNSRAENVTGKVKRDADLVARITAYFIFR